MRVIRFVQWLRAAAFAGFVLGCVVSPEARAIDSVEVPAINRTFNPVFDVEVGKAIDLVIWDQEYVSYSGAALISYAAFCRSDDDSSVGACPTTDTLDMPTRIRLKFRERRSGLEVELMAEGSRRNAFSLDPSSYVETGLAHMQHHANQYTNTTFTLVIPAGELRKLPLGGIWESALELRLVRDHATSRLNSGGPADATWIVHTTIRMRDAAQIQVYLPEFQTADPLVDLNLVTRPHASGPGSDLEGRRVIDACLYDGFNAQSDQYDIRIVDPESADGGFYVRQTTPGPPGGDTDSIPYKVFAPDPSTGISQEYQSGQSYAFGGMSAAEWRFVRLPFSPLPVVCTPWEIVLETPRFESSSKRAGRYSGSLQVHFDARISSP